MRRGSGPVRSALSTDASGSGDPAGNTVKNPLLFVPATVTLMASATASSGTPSGSAILVVDSAPTGVPGSARVSRIRCAVDAATNRPLVAVSAGTNAPTTSITTPPRPNPSWRYTSIMPPSPIVTVEVFARVMPAFQFRVAAVGRVVPAGYATSHPFCCGRTMVADTTIATASSGMPQAEVLTRAV